MYQYIDDKNYKHLIGIIIGGSEKEESIHGLAHVGEHMLLLPCFENEDEDESYSTFGYTCIDHIFLYFTSRNKSSLKKIRNKIEDKSVITTDKVEIAKHQVICECENLKDKIASNEKKVKFITENRIKNFAAGNIDDIKKITTQEMENWLECIINEKRMFFFSLEDFVYDSMQSICVKHNMNKYEQKKEQTVELLYMCKDIKCRCDLEIYAPLFQVSEKEQYLQLISDEYYIERYLIRFSDQVEVTEKFFSYTERYLLINIKNVLFDALPEIIRELKNSSEWGKKYSYKTEKENLYHHLVLVSKENESSNIDIINIILKKLLYEISFIDVKKEINLLDMIENSMSAEMQESLKNNTKIVIT